MFKISEDRYKGYLIFNQVSQAGQFYCNCESLEIQSSNPNSGNCGFNTLQEATADVKEKIDQFLKISISSINELARIITDKLTAVGYEEYYMDTPVLKNILQQTNFTAIIQELKQ